MPRKISRWGIGPIFAALLIGYGVMSFAISRYFDPALGIDILPDRFLFLFGIAMISIGVPFFIISVKTVHRAYNADALVTSGVFRCCRHPLYSSWVFFIVPGIIFLAKSWIGVTTPIFMYFLLKILVRKEEIYLENVFGTEYLEYKNTVPCIMPLGCLKFHRITKRST
jgi:protein-S-isoprenylcysteine O-methyltransferase Ste14